MQEGGSKAGVAAKSTPQQCYRFPSPGRGRGQRRRRRRSGGRSRQ